MTIAYLHLLRFSDDCNSGYFQGLLRQHAQSHDYEVVLFADARYAVAVPQVINRGRADQVFSAFALLKPNDPKQDPYVTKGGSAIPDILDHLLRGYYTLTVAISSKVLDDFARTNAELHASSVLDGAAYGAPRLEQLTKGPVTDSSQRLEASVGLLDFAKKLLPMHGLKPMTMLNLMKFNETGPGLDSYKKYGQSFKTIGGKRGGNAKLVGKVLGPAWVNGKERLGTEQWDEFAIVHYPNIVAFCDMAAGADYQEVNRNYRLPSLKDTLLIAGREMPLAAEPGTVLAKKTEGEAAKL